MTGLEFFIILSFLTLIFSAAISDLTRFKIPNKYPFFISLLFFISSALVNWSWWFVIYNLLTALVILLICFLLFIKRYIGGGDAKLFSAISLWSGLNGLYEFVLVMAFSGGGLSILLILFRKLTLSPVLKRIYWINQLHSNKNQIPYGLAIAFGALVTFDQFPIFKYINN